MSSRARLSLALLAALAPAPCTVATGAEDAPEPQDRARAGARLFAERGCVACHAVPAELAVQISPEMAPSLARAGARMSSGYVRELLHAHGRPHA